MCAMTDLYCAVEFVPVTEALKFVVIIYYRD